MLRSPNQKKCLSSTLEIHRAFGTFLFYKRCPAIDFTPHFCRSLSQLKDLFSQATRGNLVLHSSSQGRLSQHLPSVKGTPLGASLCTQHFWRRGRAAKGKVFSLRSSSRVLLAGDILRGSLETPRLPHASPDILNLSSADKPMTPSDPSTGDQAVQTQPSEATLHSAVANPHASRR